MAAGGAVTAPLAVTTFPFAALQPSGLRQVVLKQRSSNVPPKSSFIAAGFAKFCHRTNDHDQVELLQKGFLAEVLMDGSHGQLYSASRSASRKGMTCRRHGGILPDLQPPASPT